MSNPQKTSVQILDEQKKRLANLQERRTRLQVRLETERKALQDAQEEAQTLFGTSDLDALRALYRERQADNDRKVVDFVMALDEIDQRLADIERQTQL